jgi:uncharacterized protein
MKIALIGASGFVGAAVLSELVSRGHAVSAIVRNPGKIAPATAVTVHGIDATDVSAMTNALRGHDAAISAFNPGWTVDALYEKFIEGSNAIHRAVEASGVKRFIVVGGAGSLFVAPGVQLVDTPNFTDHVPPNIVPGAKAARDALTSLRSNTTLDWSFISPPAMLEPGERTGAYRVGGEQLLMTPEGAPAGISVADLAVAIVDEIEQPKHVRARFTVARL